MATVEKPPFLSFAEVSELLAREEDEPITGQEVDALLYTVLVMHENTKAAVSYMQSARLLFDQRAWPIPQARP